MMVSDSNGIATITPISPKSWAITTTPMATTAGMEVYRPRHHQRQDQIALDLVDDHVDQEHQRRLPGGVREPEEHGRNRADDRAEVRDHGEHGGKHRKPDGELQADDAHAQVQQAT